MTCPSPTQAPIAAILVDLGAPGTLHELTSRVPTPALHFTAFHRIVDFAMAALARAGVARIVLAPHPGAAQLARHLDMVWSPALAPGTLDLGPATGLPRIGPEVDPAQSLRAALDRLPPDSRDVLLVAANQVHALDLAALVSAHRAGGACLTRGQADPGTTGEAPPAAMVADRAWLRAALARRDGSVPFWHRAEADRFSWPAPAGTANSPVYCQEIASLDALREAWLAFDGPYRPCPRPVVPGAAPTLVPSAPLAHRFSGQARLGALRLMSPALAPDNAARWAVLDRSILMPGARVSPGVRLRRVIVAPGTAVPEGLVIGEDPAEDARWFRIDRGGTVLVTTEMLARRGVAMPPRRRSALARIVTALNGGNAPGKA